MLYTNWLCEIRGLIPRKQRPFIAPSQTTTLRILPRTSTIKMKRKGERGSPYLIPQLREKIEDGEPFTKIEKWLRKLGKEPNQLKRY
jgi:hypothetical protein